MDKEIGDSRTLLSVLQDFSGKHSALQYTTFLGSAAFDSYDTYRALLLLHQGVLYHQHSPGRAIYGGGQAQPSGVLAADPRRSLDLQSCYSHEPPQRLLTTKADLFLAGIVQLLCVILADVLCERSLFRRICSLTA